MNDHFHLQGHVTAFSLYKWITGEADSPTIERQFQETLLKEYAEE